MFGYIFPDKPELKIREFSDYRAVYCSLCEALRGFGFGAKALLNYDFVFAAMLMMAVNGVEQPHAAEARCNTNPLEKVNLIPQNDALRFSAAALLISGQYKLADNAADEGFFKRIAARFLMLGLGVPYRRARTAMPDFDANVATHMAAQRAFERSGIDSLDRACDPSASGLADLFGGMCADPDTAVVLRRLGYLMGRFVYLADCGDDLRDDLKKSRFNPLILRFSLTKESAADKIDEALAEGKAQLFATIAQIENCYRLLQPACYKEILDNIIYLGLYKTAREIGAKKKGKQK